MPKFNLDILSLKILEEEGKIPIAFVVIQNMPSENPDNVEFLELIKNQKLSNNKDLIKIVEDEEIIFCGSVTNVEVLSTSIVLKLQKIIDPPVIEHSTTDSEITNLLYNNENLEIPEVFCKLKVPYYDRATGYSSIVSTIYESDFIDNIESKILKDSLVINKSSGENISKVELEIRAFWISKEEGDFDITSKISNKFKGGKINTLTPRKLEASWPKFGEHIPTVKASRKTKYYFGHSRLYPENTMHMTNNDLYTPVIATIEEHPIRLRRYWYAHKLSICFGYDQYRKEILKTTINNQYCESGVTKKLCIDLKNVQKFLPSIYSRSFFETDIGKKAYKHIVNMVGLYIASSMRDISFKFSIPYSKDITCKNWINIRGHIAKITNLQFKEKNEIEVEASAFSNDSFRQFLKTHEIVINSPEIPSMPHQEKSVDDIIYNISVINDGFTQSEKLLGFLQTKSDIKSHYKQMINKFLNENQTTITIVTKPIKTQYCEERIVDLKECYFENL
jgi:hypothetical protein